MTTLAKLNKQVEEKRKSFISTTDKALKEQMLKEIEEIKKEFELDNLEDIQEDLKLHKYVKNACEKALNALIETNADAFQIKELYGNLMSAKAMINNYEQMIENNKKVCDQLIAALKANMNEKKEK